MVDDEVEDGGAAVGLLLGELQTKLTLGIQ